MFSDQDLNMKQAELAGYALTMEFGDIAEDVLQNKINNILNDTR
jgi:UDP:flavonoid glycosyltransferase YjiC (YdhE family)